MDNLTSLLEAAAKGKAEAAKSFLETLLKSDVQVPLKVGADNKKDTPKKLSQDLLTVNVDGRTVLPIFSSDLALTNWADEMPLGSTTVAFAELINLVDPTHWLHLDPNQEFGKELSPWELALLRKGVEALDEILAELDFNEGFEVENSSKEYLELKHHFSVLFEAYPWVKEAFLVKATHGEDKTQPLLGLKLLPKPSAEVRDDKREQLRSEIDSIALDQGINIQLVDDLGETNSPNQRLFKDINPFYIAQELLPNNAGLWSRLKRTLLGR
jgi:hypothetical protein